MDDTDRCPECGTTGLHVEEYAGINADGVWHCPNDECRVLDFQSNQPVGEDGNEFAVESIHCDDGGSAWLTVRVNNSTVYDGAVTEGTSVTVETEPAAEHVEKERDADE